MNTNIISNGAISTNNINKPGLNTIEVNGKGFENYLKEAINNTNEAIIKAEDTSNQFAAGNIDDIHKVLVDIEKADIALQFTLQIRNKIMDAYNEIMRMQI